MNKDIRNLNKEELNILKEDIDKQLKILEIKETKDLISNKDSILNLREGDKIFGIRLSFGAHKLEEPQNLIGKVDVVDYCIVENMNLRNDNSIRIKISHPSSDIALGIHTTLEEYECKYEHALLKMDTFKSGYDQFYTLKPENWKEDLVRLYKQQLEEIKKEQKEEFVIYKNKLNFFLESEEYINEHI